jgi:hypothetical protein
MRPVDTRRRLGQSLRSTSAPKPPNRACFARPARLSARSGCSRPIFDPDLAEFRAEPVRTTLGAALRRRPCAAPRARALSPLRNDLPTGPSLSHLSLPRTPQRSGPVASRSVLATEFGAYRGRRNIIDQFHPNWKPRRYSSPPSLGSRVPAAAAGQHLPPVREGPRHGDNYPNTGCTSSRRTEP